jgi:hypothetical protein
VGVRFRCDCGYSGTEPEHDCRFDRERERFANLVLPFALFLMLLFFVVLCAGLPVAVIEAARKALRCG